MTEIIDMARFTEAKSDQLNADDLIGATRKLRVTRVTGSDGDQPIAVHYEGDNGKPFKPCKTMRRVLAAVWGRFANEYVGRTMVVYRDDKVTFGGLEVGGIRISHMSHIDKETVVVVMKSKGKKAGIKVLPLKEAASPPANSTGREKAEKWVVQFAENPVEGPGTERALEKLKREHPDLYEKALEVRKQATEDEADPFNPENEFFGGDDPPTLDEAKRAIDAAGLSTDIRALLSSYAGQLSEDDLEEVRKYGFARIETLEAA